jgi:predicted nucleic acid-binding protein
MRALLDTNIVIGLLTDSAAAVAAFRAAHIPLSDCAVSVITRLEVLGWPKMTVEAERLAKRFLGGLTVLPLSEAIENTTITLRRTHSIKLPDAIILATAKAHQLPLITLDKALAKQI